MRGNEVRRGTDRNGTRRNKGDRKEHTERGRVEQ
jgi:hypothetical protein